MNSGGRRYPLAELRERKNRKCSRFWKHLPRHFAPPEECCQASNLWEDGSDGRKKNPDGKRNEVCSRRVDEINNVVQGRREEESTSLRKCTQLCRGRRPPKPAQKMMRIENMLSAQCKVGVVQQRRLRLLRET
ncbi:hypothetical protein Bbelb_265850 [Branchiostoma belcheri]|nr:hypothetical protein Bbelb_265850 [Branchiostoma belcheri]